MMMIRDFLLKFIAFFVLTGFFAKPLEAVDNILINEVIGSTTGSDVEFIELYGAPNATLSGLSILIVEGDATGGKVPGTIEKRIDFTGTHALGCNGFFLVGNPLVIGQHSVTPDYDISANYIQNGSYTVVLIATASISGTTFTGSEDNIMDAFGFLDDDAGDVSYANPSQEFGPDGAFLPAGARRDPDGSDTFVAGDFTISENTPESASCGQTETGPTDVTLIHDIQGSGEVSPLVDKLVKIQGIVIGDFQDGDADESRNLDGFFVQEEEADYDTDPLTSEGIFVFEGSSFIVDVNVGDKVEVVGTISEAFGQTQISATTVAVMSSGNNLPSATSIELPANETILVGGDYLPDLEAYEGMLVTFSDKLTITEMFNLDRFNEIKLVAGDRPYQFTQLNEPNATAFDAYLEKLGKRQITYDDGLGFQNALIGNLEGFGPTYSTTSAPRMGDNIENLRGVLTYAFSAYRVRATGVEPLNVFTSDNPRPISPPDVGSVTDDQKIKVVSLNVLNFFTTLDEGSNTAGPNNLNPRGANNQEEYNRQLQKLLTAIEALDADILGLNELENEFGDQNGDGTFAIGALVESLNTATGSEAYTYVDPGTAYIGTDAIASGFIFKTSRIETVGGPAILDSSVDETFIDTKNRPALAQSFGLIGNNNVCVTISVNHLKSKGSACDDVGDPDPIPDDGTGSCNNVRSDAAEALASWMKSDPTGEGCKKLVILGDLNSYASEGPISKLQEAGFENSAGNKAYSFVFDGQVGTLDYIFTRGVQGIVADIWHVNEDEADALDYNLDFGRDDAIFDGNNPARYSDHSPLIAVFPLKEDCQTPLGLNGTTMSIDFFGLFCFEFCAAVAPEFLSNIGVAYGGC